ncbi:MAG TPA: hypothetical protein VF613_20045 [Longimicrobium sp.]|jgi:hypothetical protein
MRVWLYAFAAIIALTSLSAGAQSCAILPAEKEADVLEGLYDMLFNPEFAESRDSAIQLLGPVTDPGMAVKDDSVCRAVAQRMVARERQFNDRWKQQDPQHTTYVFRFGPYYVGMVRERAVPSPGALTTPTGRGMNMIFRAADLEYVLGVV